MDLKAPTKEVDKFDTEQVILWMKKVKFQVGLKKIFVELSEKSCEELGCHLGQLLLPHNQSQNELP